MNYNSYHIIGFIPINELMKYENKSENREMF